MLNQKGERELAYVVIIDDITPIDGYDRVELAHVGGWTVVVGKGEFHPGDPAIYFEIDSKLPEIEPFSNMDFLVKKHYKVKTQRMCKSISQGLLMSAENFGWRKFHDGVCRPDGTAFIISEGSRFLTKALDVTYVVPEDNERKSSVDKYKKMAQRHGKLFSKQPFRWLMRRTWGKKLLFVFFGKKKDKRGWPAWVSKTDEERVQNMTWVLTNKEPMVVTEKIDGTSTTFTLKKGKFGKTDFYVCSRNVVFDKPDKTCFYETNVYTEMAEKYDIENKMKKMLNDLDTEWVTIQGETFGKGVQNRDYSLNEHDFRAFNLVTPKEGRWGTTIAQKYLEIYDIPFVPILDDKFILPDTVEELLDYATGKSVFDDKLREGVVIRSFNGSLSFKAVSNDYLLEYH